MDFVVAGLGFGALLIVIGFVVRDLGPLLWRSSLAANDADTFRLRRSRLHLCQATANALMTGGGIPLLATIAAVAAGLADRPGSVIVLLSGIVGLVLAAFLAAVAFRNYRAEMPMLAPLGRSAARSSSLSTPDAGALTSVRRVAKPAAPAAAEGAADPPVAPDTGTVAADIAGFDPNKLFAFEFDHEGDDNDPMLPRRPVEPAHLPEPAADTAASEGTLATEPSETSSSPPPEAAEPEPAPQPAAEPSEADPSDTADAPIPVGESGGTDEVLSVTVRPLPSAPPRSTPAPAPPVEAVPEVPPAAEQPQASEETPSAAEPERPATEPVFQSRLLADIGPDSTAGNGAEFASEVLAGVAQSEPPAATFKSPLLADLGSRERENAADDREGEAEQKRRSLFSRRHNRR